MSSDEEFPPLLESGLQRMNIAELQKLVVEQFSYSTSRVELWKNFSELLDTLARLKLPCDIWVDGSFLTKKINPKDVDFLVELPIEILSALNEDQKNLIDNLSRRAFYTGKKLDSYVKIKIPNQGHHYHAKALLGHNQWLKDFGQSYIKKEPKGIAVIEVLP